MKSINFSKALQIAVFVLSAAQELETIKAAKTPAAKRAAIKILILEAPGFTTALDGLSLADKKKFDAALNKVVDGVFDILNLTIWKS